VSILLLCFVKVVNLKVSEFGKHREARMLKKVGAAQKDSFGRCPWVDERVAQEI